jgi:hypothetical protein
MATTPNTKVRNQPKRVSDGKEVLVGVIVAREYFFKTIPVLVRVVFLQDQAFYRQAYPSTIKVLQRQSFRRSYLTQWPFQVRSATLIH